MSPIDGTSGAASRAHSAGVRPTARRPACRHATVDSGTVQLHRQSVGTWSTVYTAPELLDILIRNKTDAYGTVCSNRRNLPPDFSRDKLKRVRWERGRKGRCLHYDGERRKTHLLSTVHNAMSSSVKTKGGQDVQKPNVILDYNHTMGGVDKADQELTFYPIMRKQQKCYYKKIFCHRLKQCLWNAYVLFLQHSERTSTTKSVEHAVRPPSRSNMPTSCGWRLSEFSSTIRRQNREELQDVNLHRLETRDEERPDQNVRGLLLKTEAWWKEDQEGESIVLYKDYHMKVNHWTNLQMCLCTIHSVCHSSIGGSIWRAIPVCHVRVWVVSECFNIWV